MKPVSKGANVLGAVASAWARTSVAASSASMPRRGRARAPWVLVSKSFAMRILSIVSMSHGGSREDPPARKLLLNHTLLRSEQSIMLRSVLARSAWT